MVALITICFGVFLAILIRHRWKVRSYRNRDRMYHMVAPVGSWRHEDCQHYAKWQRVWKWWLPWPVGKEFWIDLYGFESIR